MLCVLLSVKGHASHLMTRRMYFIKVFQHTGKAPFAHLWWCIAQKPPANTSRWTSQWDGPPPQAWPCVQAGGAL